ncbi:YitT family protein [Caproiciproducens sp. MSJ-32]|uniref:YitT family protein n=1 Tax=Caproiciproducens sp. MSJ-32 TaxID=2841527 RepID=UPI001C10F8B8|nr:YitT family protein [Caproiciproducens sp. MSJ-32]MBU5454663.1 YitT family protein [Caproiciproducens sp. MSJ-32]
MKDKLKEYLLIFIGVILVALALEYFFIPNDIAAGGVTGLAVVITQYLPIISTGSLVFIMNIILFIVGFIFLGKAFGLKTIIASLLLSGVMIFIEQFFKPFAVTGDLMLASIFGTAITALGMGIIFNVNASTGGTDIVAKILNDYFNIDVGKSLLVVDFIITLLGAVTFGLDKGLYAMLTVVMNGILIDKVIEGFKKCKEVVIISTENEKICKFILNELDRGCTYLKGIGAFSGEETRVIYSVLGRSEFIRLKQYIAKVDPQAFITVGEVHEVMGEGFGDLG